MQALGLTRHDSLDDLLPLADVVVLMTPMTAGNHHMLDECRINTLKHGAHV